MFWDVGGYPGVSQEPIDNVGAVRTAAALVATRHAEMAAFDALPAELRHALAHAPMDWSSLDILARYRRARRRYPERRVIRAALALIASARTQ